MRDPRAMQDGEGVAQRTAQNRVSEHEQFEEISTRGDLALDCQSLNGIVRHGVMVRVPEGKKDIHISASDFGWGQSGIHTWR